MRLTAQELYDRLLNVEHILEIEGQIRFDLGDIGIVVRQKDVVGNIMQEWLQGWLDAKDIEYAICENTQMPPDFFLNPDDRTRELLEVKAFNRNASPGFDIADFRMYAEEIQEKPYMLDVDYLIFGYDMSETGVVTIKDVWLKKVWEITRRMENYPLNLQIKNGVIHKIRPSVWYTQKPTSYASFACLEDFVSAVEETTFKEPKLRDSIASSWLEVFQQNYKSRYGKELDVPRWKDIKDKYDCTALNKKTKLTSMLGKAGEQKNKAENRVLKYQKAVIEAKTEKQLKSANESLKKAQKNLNSALKKVSDLQLQINKFEDKDS